MRDEIQSGGIKVRQVAEMYICVETSCTTPETTYNLYSNNYAK